MMTMRYDDDFPPMGVRSKIVPTVTMPQVVERPASFAPPIDYQIAFHSHMIRTFGTLSTLYYEQSHVHLYPSTIRWCQDLSAAAAFHAQYHTHQLILVKEMQARKGRLEIYGLDAQKKTTPFMPMTMGHTYTQAHYSALDRNKPIVDIALQQEPDRSLPKQSCSVMITNGEPRKTDNTGTQKENQDTSLLEKPMTELSHVEDLTSFTCQPEGVTVPASDQKSITTGKAKDANGHKARWILIKISGGEAVPAKSTNFDYWAVTFTGTKDHDYPQANSDVSAYEVLERQESAPHRKTQRLATLSDR
jgi:hypothetical protein